MTSLGMLTPNNSMVLPIDEAKQLASYRGILDSAKVTGMAQLEAEIADLKVKLAEAQAIIASATLAPAGDSVKEQEPEKEQSRKHKHKKD